MYYDLSNAHAFAANVCSAMELYTYTAVCNIGPNSIESLPYGNWAGNVPENPKTSSPMLAYHKMGEMVLMHGGEDGVLVMSPIDNKYSLGLMGGVGLHGFIVAVSKLAGEHDKLIALITLYHTVQQRLKLHHVGYRYPDLDSYKLANSQTFGGMERPAEDHLRTYFKTSSWHYRENQYFPGEKLELARHWDFVTDDPGHFLRFIARAYGQEPATWEPGENDPVGVVWIRGEDGQLYGVMARSNWWTVEGDEKQLPLQV